MADRNPAPRWLLPAEDDLIRAIGRAVYGFAQFERSAERAREALDGPLAGRSNGHALGGATGELLRILGLRRDLKERLDGLLYARPDAAEGSAAAGCAWDTEGILRLAREAEGAAIEANRLLRKHLRPPCRGPSGGA